MEGESPGDKAVPNKRGKGEIRHEATGLPSQKPPLDDSEPPPLEEVSEPHSKASTPPLSSPLSGELENGFSPPSSYPKKGDSPLSFPGRVLSPSLYSQRAQSPSSYIEEGDSPSSYVEELHSPSSYTDDQRGENLKSNAIPPHNEPSPVHAGINNSYHTHTKTGFGFNTSTATSEKVDVKPSLRTSIPSLAHSVASAAKHVSFKSGSLSSRSSSAIYGPRPWWKGSPQQMKIVEAALRIGGAILALITFSVLCATSEWRSGAGSTFKMSFTDYQAYNYLVAVNVLSFVYSCWQSVVISQSRFGGVFSTSRENMLFTYVCDQVLAFLLFSASTAAATAAQLSRHGLHNIWPPACATWSLWRFCAKADAAVVMSFFSSFFVISSSVFSGYHISNSLLE